MASINGKNHSEDETSFNISEIDSQISKNDEFIQKSVDKKGAAEKIKNKFKYLPSFSKEEIKTKDPNSEYPKYFAKIKTKDFEYIGVLTNELKREKYGYSIMENKDEYLGEYKCEIREGFGIYKFSPNEDEEDIYIGDYKNNRKTGEGLYLKIFKSVKDKSTNDIILIDFSCGIGSFEDDLFKEGKIFTVNNEDESFFKGKVNDIGLPSDDEALIFKQGDSENKIFRGKIVDGDLVEGRYIYVDEKWDKKNSYYFIKNNNKETMYDFDINKNEEQDSNTIKMMKDSSIKTYRDQIQNIFKDVNMSFDKFKNYDVAISVNFDNDVKNLIKNKVEKLNKD